MIKHFTKEKDKAIIGISDKLLSMLDNAREAAGVPFVLTSGLRTPEHNAEVGGAVDSAHLKGLAVDIQCTDSQNRFAIVYGLFLAGFKRLEIGKGHIHADIDDTKAQRVIFLE
jgi:hypothetical protein